MRFKEENVMDNNKPANEKKKIPAKLFMAAQKAETAEELIKIVKEINLDYSEAQIKAYFDAQNKNGELSDDELDNVSGGGCGDDIDVRPNECDSFSPYLGGDKDDYYYDGNPCARCRHWTGGWYQFDCRAEDD